jgi:hypothetical protein
MIQVKTVFVLGAGSSVEFGLPDGVGIIDKISLKTDFNFNPHVGRKPKGDPAIMEELQRKAHGKINQFISAANKISVGIKSSRSVDDFLYNHGHDEYIVRTGKLAIVSTILDAERSSKLYVPGIRDQFFPNSPDDLKETWLYKLFQFIQTGVRKSDIEHIFDNIEIINFNYDRCVEFFLFKQIQASYDLSESEAIPIMRSLKITHPYGTVGRLPWEVGTRESVNFGQESARAPLFVLSDQIKTFTEQSHEESDREYWRHLISSCTSLIFLGFGFHKQNIELLAAKETVSSPPRVLGTAYRTSPSDRAVFENLIWRTLLRGGVNHRNIIDTTCSALIKDFGLSLFT